ncbi:NAD-dependent glycerol-3-phosphate dehydrogenase [Auriculariales sp. MPI-PUGE-AT-0066]|nr:NAD-dependent glycerol-3-phosphate dehydrogenase [Auriculariales sp. MPI-PUGE-AT-0066]
MTTFEWESTDIPAMQTHMICVLGAGNFGSCLADHLADSAHEVFLWGRDKEVIDSLNATHRNPKYLKDHVFPSNLKAIGPEPPSAELLRAVEVILFAIPTQGLRQTLTELRPRLDENNLPLLIFVNKGIERGTNALTLEIIADTCGPAVAKVATFISGPSFAKEIVQRQPTSVTVCSLSKEHALKASKVFHQPWFRCYTGDDPIGVELSGALKNVYAIATGMVAGLGFDSNARAACMTRSLAEMTKIGRAYGASPLTFLTLAGVGDLFLTCSSSASRNYTVGYRLGKGEKLDYILETLGSVAEGVSTTEGCKAIVDELGVKASIATGVYQILFQGANVTEVAKQLLMQPAGAELDLPQVGEPAKRLMRKLGLEESFYE